MTGPSAPSSAPTSSALIDRASATGLVVFWSSGFVGGSLASLGDASVLLVLLWRFALASLLLAPFVWLAWRSAAGRPALRSELIRQAGIGVLAMGGYIALVVRAIELGVPAGTTALITALQPMLTAAVAGPLLGERLGRWGWAGLAIGFVGVSVAVRGSAGSAPGWAYALPLGAVLCVVTASVATRGADVDRPALSLPAVVGVQSAATTVALLAPAALAGPLAPPPAPLFWASVAWFVVLSTLGAYGFYWLCLRRTGAIRVASLMYLTAPVTAVWAWAMFGEPITLGIVLGFALCLVGVRLAARSAPGAMG